MISEQPIAQNPFFLKLFAEVGFDKAAADGRIVQRDLKFSTFEVDDEFFDFFRCKITGDSAAFVNRRLDVWCRMKLSIQDDPHRTINVHPSEHAHL